MISPLLLATLITLLRFALARLARLGRHLVTAFVLSRATGLGCLCAKLTSPIWSSTVIVTGVATISSSLFAALIALLGITLTRFVGLGR